MAAEETMRAALDALEHGDRIRAANMLRGALDEPGHDNGPDVAALARGVAQVDRATRHGRAVRGEDLADALDPLAMLRATDPSMERPS